jgi:hypothetical protein
VEAIELESFDLVDESETLLREAWGRRHRDGDILVLCDLRREELVPDYSALWGQDVVYRTSKEASGRPVLACRQPRKFP